MSPKIQSHRPEKPIRSFTIRGGRITQGQRQALDRLFPDFAIHRPATPYDSVDFDNIFGRAAPTILEIGFGDGEALLEMAVINPQNNYIGIEVYEPGIGHLLLRANEQQIDNIRVFHGDAVEILETDFPDDTLDRICLFFPDPWPKKRHHKRRIVQRHFINVITQKLKPGGLLHFATDWQEYALDAHEKLDDCGCLVNLAANGNHAVSSLNRPETKFEKRGLRLGHSVWEIVMQKPKGATLVSVNYPDKS